MGKADFTFTAIAVRELDPSAGLLSEELGNSRERSPLVGSPFSVLGVNKGARGDRKGGG